MSLPLPGQPILPAGLWSSFGLVKPRAVEGPYFGFSSAVTWKAECGGRIWAIKRLRLDQREISSRSSTHAVLRLLHEKHQLPVPLPRGLVSLDGWKWECHSWLPGYVLGEWGHAHRSAAPQLLGKLHGALAGTALPLRPGRFAQLSQSASVRTRIAGLSQPIDFPRARNLIGPLGEFFSRVNSQVWMAFGEDCARRLRTWKRPVWLQAIHGDSHPGNWLWENEKIGGLIDFLDASEAGDPRELDLARLLASAVMPGNPALAEAVESYEAAASGSSIAPPLDAELVRLLECSGVWLRIANWEGMLGTPGEGARSTRVSPELTARLEQLVSDARAWLGVFWASSK